MNQWFKGMMVVSALIVGCASSQAQQLLNGSFEEPETQKENPYGDLASNWGRWGNWMNRETGWTPTHNGQCLLGYHHWEITDSADSGIYQDIPGIPAGKTVLFSVYAAKDDKTDAESIEVRLEALNGGQTLASKTYKMDEVKAASWTPLSIVGTNQAEGIRVLVIIKPKADGPRNGAVKLDDAEVSVQ